MSEMKENLHSADDSLVLDIQNLTVHYELEDETVEAVNDISIQLKKGQILGLVGETGAGKTSTALAALNLIPDPPGVIKSGVIRICGKDILSLSTRQMRKRRGDMQIIFQDPFFSLNPRNTVMQTIAEGVRMTGKYKTREEIENRVVELMETVGLAERLINSYPHELDGGRRQRIGIARALAVEPKLIVCDEPVSALDVSIQAQILNLLKELQKKLGLTYIFITHDLAVVNHISDHIMVMYLGQTVEVAPAEELFSNPIHPYTRALLSAIPIPKVGGPRKERILLKGEVTSPINPGNECRFAKRCQYACDTCRNSCPELKEVAPGHFVACHCFPE